VTYRLSEENVGCGAPRECHGRKDTERLFMEKGTRADLHHRSEALTAIVETGLESISSSCALDNAEDRWLYSAAARLTEPGDNTAVHRSSGWRGV
jgi:hypothetical protein